MKPNKFREMMNAGTPTMGTHIHSTWPSIIEVVGHTGVFDYVEFVEEYGPWDLYAFDDMGRTAELHQLGSMIKVEAESRGFIAQRAIGSGFESVLFSDCRSAAEAQECVNICRADTGDGNGTYGVATRRFTYMGYGGSAEYVNMINDVVVVLMIEKQSAVEQLDEILDIDGVEMIQWGPGDYSMNTGRMGQHDSSEIKKVEREVIAKALQAGVHPRAEIVSPDQAKYYLDLGVRHFCMETDIAILFKWLKENGEELRRSIDG